MTRPVPNRRFHLLRRSLALGTCLGPVGHLFASGQLPRDPALPVLACEPYRKPDFGPPCDGTVGVVGLGYYTAAIVALCGEIGLPVGFVVDDREGADGDPFGAVPELARRRIPLLSTAEFAERGRRTADGLTLVAGRIDCQLPLALADDPYRRMAAWVGRTLPGQEAPLHPAALLAWAEPVPCPNRFALFGFPGSGNVLTQNLIEGMYARHPAEVPLDWQVRANLSEHYFYGVWARLHALLAPRSPTSVEFIPHEFGTMMVAVECGDRAGVAFGVPSQRHLGLQTYPTHSRPTRAAVDFFAANAAPCVAVVRHPLETLLSQANKIERPARAVLDGPLFLDRAAAQLADWTAHLLANRDRVQVVRYEDLAERRIDAVMRLAAWLGLPLTAAEAGPLLDGYLNRNLPSAVPSHFYRGGSDKWRAEFTPPQLRRALAHLPTEVFTAFGYAVPTEADLSPPSSAGKPMRSELYACLLESHPFHPVPGPHGIRVTGSDEAMAAGLLAVFQDAGLLAYLAAGGLSGTANADGG